VGQRLCDWGPVLRSGRVGRNCGRYVDSRSTRVGDLLPCWWLATVAVTVPFLAASCASSSPKPALAINNSPAAYCRGGNSLGDWSHLRSHPTAFGLDYLSNQSSKPLTVDSIDLLNAHSLRLVGAAIVPEPHASGGVGDGLAWPPTSSDVDPALWRLREDIPGAVIPPEGGPFSKVRSPYQVVVGVQPTTTTGGWADGITVTYHQGGRHRILSGVIRLGVESTLVACGLLHAGT